MDKLYQWPNAEMIYPDRKHKTRKLKRFRFNLRSYIHFPIVKKFCEFVNHHKLLVDWLNHQPMISYALVHRFLDKRFNALQRLQAMQENLVFLPQKLSILQYPPLCEKPILLSEIEGKFELYLTINVNQPMEGFWALELREKETKKELYVLTFGKVQEALLIGSVQGPNFEGSKEAVKYLTKQCHGLRPMQLMIEAMKILTTTLGFAYLWGIPQKYQNKSRIIQAKRYTVDYDAMFQESGAKFDRYWHIPLRVEQRDLTEIPSKKRSMYRKRHTMLTQLAQSIHDKLTPS